MSRFRPFLERIPRLLETAAGLWLMIMPGLFDYAGTAAASSDRIAGPFVVCFSFVAIWEATRAVRLASVPFALWVIVSPFLLGHPPPAVVGCVVAGVVILICCFLGGAIRQRFGGGWSSLARRTPRNELLTRPS